MNAYIDENGNIVFETDHFSEYVVTSEKIEGAIETDTTDSDTSSDDSDSETTSDSEATSSDSNTSNSGADKENVDTGFGGVIMTVGIVALAGAAIVVAKKKH